VLGKRDGLDFVTDQAWKLYNDLVLGQTFNNALNLLEIFVDEFGAEVEFQGKISKFFLSAIAKSEKEFIVKIDNDKLTKNKKSQSSFTAFHFVKNISQGDKKYSLFFIIDLNKYRKYINKHKTM
jgi:hypothetical protein